MTHIAQTHSIPTKYEAGLKNCKKGACHLKASLLPLLLGTAGILTLNYFFPL